MAGRAGGSIGCIDGPWGRGRRANCAAGVGLRRGTRVLRSAPATGPASRAGGPIGCLDGPWGRGRRANCAAGVVLRQGTIHRARARARARAGGRAGEARARALGALGRTWRTAHARARLSHHWAGGLREGDWALGRSWALVAAPGARRARARAGRGRLAEPASAPGGSDVALARVAEAPSARKGTRARPSGQLCGGGCATTGHNPPRARAGVPVCVRACGRAGGRARRGRGRGRLGALGRAWRTARARARLSHHWAGGLREGAWAHLGARGRTWRTAHGARRARQARPVPRARPWLARPSHVRTHGHRPRLSTPTWAWLVQSVAPGVADTTFFTNSFYSSTKLAHVIVPKFKLGFLGPNPTGISKFRLGNYFL